MVCAMDDVPPPLERVRTGMTTDDRLMEDAADDDA